jgi:hypothetical protein
VSAPVGHGRIPVPDEPGDSLKWVATLLLAAVTLAALTLAGKLDQ